ncbi:MAG: UPF0175 family protein [Ginsengibacter sp.]|jgi:predicted HTH domain antitoxin
MLEINEDLAKDIHMSEPELKLEFAIWLYETDKISLRKAAKVAELDWEAFSEILNERNIPTVKMTNKEFETTVATVNRLLK